MAAKVAEVLVKRLQQDQPKHEAGPDLKRLFRQKVERLKQTLNSEPDVRTKAAPILRTLIDEIVLRAGDKRGKMSIEVHGEPSALFLLAGDETAAADNWMISVVAEDRSVHSPRRYSRFI